MDAKMPYYMAYPMPFSYDDERTERMDFEYMKSMYPDTAKRILPYVEEECDRMEYENSMVYDQCPDKLQLRLMSRRVYDNVRKHERMFFGDEEGCGAVRAGRRPGNRYFRDCPGCVSAAGMAGSNPRLCVILSR